MKTLLPKKAQGFSFMARYGNRDYGFRLWKAEQKLIRLGPEWLAVKLARQQIDRQRAMERLTPGCLAWIRRNDRPDLFVNDRRAYYREVYLKSEHWRELRARKLKTSPVYEVCSSRDRVEPHHLRYKNLYDVELEELQTLCRWHHVPEHERLDREKRFKHSRAC